MVLRSTSIKLVPKPEVNLPGIENIMIMKKEPWSQIAMSPTKMTPTILMKMATL